MSTLDDVASQLSRVTVVDETGIQYERYDLDVELHLQDQGRTLKAFVRGQDTKRPDGYEDVADIDNGVATVFAAYPGDTWRLEPLRDVVRVILRGKP